MAQLTSVFADTFHTPISSQTPFTASQFTQPNNNAFLQDYNTQSSTASANPFSTVAFSNTTPSRFLTITRAPGTPPCFVRYRNTDNNNLGAQDNVSVPSSFAHDNPTCPNSNHPPELLPSPSSKFSSAHPTIHNDTNLLEKEHYNLVMNIFRYQMSWSAE